MNKLGVSFRVTPETDMNEELHLLADIGFDSVTSPVPGSVFSSTGVISAATVTNPPFCCKARNFGAARSPVCGETMSL